jgi:hypothetical protein
MAVPLTDKNPWVNFLTFPFLHFLVSRLFGQEVVKTKEVNFELESPRIQTERTECRR